MKIYNIHDKIVYKHNYTHESEYREELSKLLIGKFGNNPIDTKNEVREALNFSLDYFIKSFKVICKQEKSLSFYQNILFLHDQASALLYKHHDDSYPKELNLFYISKYRRILKFIIEETCHNELYSREPWSDALMVRIQETLDELMYLGEMIIVCTEMYAEQDMIEDVAKLYFDENNNFVFTRKHHYNQAFNETLLRDWGAQLVKEAFDQNAVEDFKSIINKAYGIEYDYLGGLITGLHEQFEDKEGEYTGFNWDALAYNLELFFKVSQNDSIPFLKGLTLSKENKKSLFELACKPFLIDKYLYKPIIIWTVDKKEFAFLTKNAWAESIIQLTTNAIPWGKYPDEWKKNTIMKSYVHQKENEHDSWLDNEVESLLIKKKLRYNRNIKSINGKSIIDTPGEIDFIIISPLNTTVYVVDCKHLLGRYDMRNQKNDFNNFVGTNNKSYNAQIERKTNWIKMHLSLIEAHFNCKLENFLIKGCFIINTPTFYMYNSTHFRLYTIEQFDKVLDNTFKDKRFTYKGIDKSYEVFFPYFQLPEYYENK